jgi:succinyl-CoA synthetase alpha subunit
MLLLPENAKLIGQGITGSEGSRALEWALSYGTNFVAGVTPGKGGQEVQGIPVFNSVKEAIEAVGDPTSPDGLRGVNGSVLFVPPMVTKAACFEALEAGVKFVLAIAEKVPTKDSALMYAKAKECEATLIGPNSVGLINPKRQLKIGLIGGGEPAKVFADGNVAVVSKSGSMTAEISIGLKNAGLGVSWACGIGGDRIIGTDFGDFLLSLEQDEQTKCSVIFGELGGTYEERVAELVSQGRIHKPVVAFIGGDFTLNLPSEVQFGHAGAIIEGDRGKPDHKRKVLKEAGVKVAEDLDQIPELVKESLGSRGK